MHSTQNSLPEATRQSMVALLNQNLATLVDLTTQLKQAHWNVKGPSFIALHELFDTITASVRDLSDTTAERAVALGGTARGTARNAVEGSTLSPYPSDITAGSDHAAAIAGALATAGGQVRASIEKAAEAGDSGTEDLFTELSRALDKHLWFVEAHLQAER